MTNQQSTKPSRPRIGSFNLPTTFVALQLPAVFIAPHFVVLSVRRNQFDATPLPSLSQRVGVVAAIRDHPFRFLPRPALHSGDADFGERGVRKRNFCRGGTSQPNSQRNTFTVSQYHPLRALAAHDFTDCGAPFFAGAKLPSRKVSSHLSRPFSSSAPAAHATLPATRLPLATAAIGASRSRARETRQARIATLRRFAELTICPRNTLDSRPVVVLDCLAVASAWGAKAQSVATARPSTASAASSWQKLNSSTVSSVST
jgi:hypothetical protein